MSSEYTGIIEVGTADDGNAQFEARVADLLGMGTC